MKEECIILETAKLAKEKGFDIGCNGSYTEFHKTHKSDNPSFAMKKGEVEFDGSSYNINNSPMSDFSNKNYTTYSAPTQGLLQKWLREKYHLYVRVATNSITTHFPMIELAEVGGTHLKGPVYDKNYETYEEALEVGLQEALKLI
jgi:hypothetical protein